MTKLHQSTLGKPVAYPAQYDPSLLFSIDRLPSRQALGLKGTLPFTGIDIWNAYELSWLNAKGKPEIAIARFIFPVESPFLIESKSFKLYLGSFADMHFPCAQTLQAILQKDLTTACGATVQVRLSLPEYFYEHHLADLKGLLLDRLDIETDCYQPDPQLLSAHHQEAPIEEKLVSHLLKSNCPMTGQPDWASVRIHYIGAPIDQAGLLRYLISYRHHTGFHEQCIEQIFLDIQRICQPIKLCVEARYTRRGGLDINPIRSNFNIIIPDSFDRLARQ